jgi:ABC-type iron transport system FetAB permease component
MFSTAGILTIVLSAVIVLGLFHIVDHPTRNRVLKVLVYFMISMALLTTIIYTVNKSERWWVYGLYAIAMIIAVALIVMRRVKLKQGKVLACISLAVALGMGYMTGVMKLLLSIPTLQLLIPVVVITAAQLMLSMTDGLNAYCYSMRNTKPHRHYMLANGATPFEANRPSIWRGLKAAMLNPLRSMTSPVVIAPPMLFCGMLLAGMDVVTATMISVATAINLLAASALSVGLVVFLISWHSIYSDE